MVKETPARVALYARVSTSNGSQDPELQLRELRDYVARRGWPVAREFVDHGISGAKDQRPALDAMMQEARRGRVDAVVVWKFDRFARSVRHLVLALDEFRGLDVAFVSVTEAIDTSTAIGRVVFTVVAAMAEFERELIRERVKAGVAKAKATGKRLGRPRAVLDIDAARDRLAHGDSLRAVCKALDVDRRTLARALKGGGAKSPSKPAPRKARKSVA